MTDEDSSSADALTETFRDLIDKHYWGPDDESQEGMTFQPGERVRLAVVTEAVHGDPEAWLGLLCQVIKSRKPPPGTEVLPTDEVCILRPLESRPDIGTMDDDDWFMWQTAYLTRA